MSDHYIDGSGTYLGAFGAGVTPPVGGVIVAQPPTDARAIWNGSSYDEPANFPADVEMWRFIRGLIRSTLDLAREQSNWAWQAGDVRSYVAVRAAAWAQESNARDEWEAISVLSLDPTSPNYWPHLWAGVRTLLPSDAQTDDFLREVFLRAPTA